MFKLFFQNIHDRLTGHSQRANAQLGLVNPPEGSGKIICVVAGRGYDSVLMAVTLMAAIREKRQDVRLVLTYQTEYQDLIITHLSGLKKIGFGYACGDTLSAADRMFKRLNPFAIIFVGNEPHRTLITAIEKKRINHLIAFQYKPAYSYPSTFYEACYPDSMSNDDFNEKSCEYISKPVNVLSRLMQSQVDKQLGAILCGSVSTAIFHVHNLPEVNEMLMDWKKSILSSKNLLILSFSELDSKKIISLEKSINSIGFSPVLLSQWKQNSLSSQHIVIADEKKWYAAICASAIATHLFQTDKNHFWQAVSCCGGNISRDSCFTQLTEKFITLFSCHQTIKEVLEHWLMFSDDPVKQRSHSDAIRKAFWSERRTAEEQTNELLQRIFDW